MSFFNHFGYAGGQKQALVFIHGAGMDSTVWAAQARYFAARGHKVLAPDLPGHGHSKGEALASVGAMAAWLNAELANRDVGEATLVGHSMGAFVGLELGGLRPNDPLVLLGAAATMPVHQALLAAALEDLPAAAEMIADWGFVSGVQRRAQALPSTSMAWNVRRLLERSRAGVLANDLEACAAYDQALQRVVERQAPLRVIAGSADRMTPLAGAKSLTEVRPESLSIVQQAGHMMFIEAPAEVRRLIAASLV